MEFVGSEDSRRVDGVTASGLDVGQVKVRVILAFHSDHGERLSEGAVKAFYAAVRLEVIEANVNCHGCQAACSCYGRAWRRFRVHSRTRGEQPPPQVAV